MRAQTANQALAAGRTFTEPVFLMEIVFPGLTLRISDAVRHELGQEWAPLVASWGALEDVLHTTDVDGQPATFSIECFNTMSVAGRTRLSDLILTPLNPTGHQWAFARATVYRLDAGLGLGDEQPLGVFFLEDPTDVGEERLTVRMSDQSLVLKNQMKVTRITRTEFPDASRAVVGRSIPVPVGVLKNVPTIPVVDGVVSRLAGALTDTQTTVPLADASDFPDSGTVQVDTEQISYTSKSGNTLQGTVTRGANSTTAAAHADTSTVFEVRSGSNAYRFAVGENVGGHLIQDVTNIRVNGRPARTSPTVQLAETGLVAGKSLALVSFTPSDVKAFHTMPIANSGPAATNIPLALDETINSVGNSTWDRALTVTLGNTAAEFGSGVVRRTVVMTFQVISGTFSLSGTNTVKRTDPATGEAITLFSDNAGPTFDFTGGTWEYVTGTSLANETFDLHLSGDADSWRFIWTITVYDVAVAISGGGGGLDSTASIVIGAVTCDVMGVRDDAAGSLSGVPSQLLENPAHVTEFILTKLYPNVTARDLGPTWQSTRARLATDGYKWAFLLEFTEFQKLRRTLGQQARSRLYLEAGKWELRYIETRPPAALVLDYGRDLWASAPAAARRTLRPDIRNSLLAYSQRDFTKSGGLDEIYQRVTPHKDLGQGLARSPGQADDDELKYDLELDWVQDPATADALGDFWLSRWKRQRWAIDLVAWQNILALEKADAIAIDNHPVLAAHGGTSLVFEITEKRYLLGDDNPSRIRLTAIEANP